MAKVPSHPSKAAERSSGSSTGCYVLVDDGEARCSVCVGTGCGKTLPFLCITALRSTCKHTFFILLLGKPLLLSGGISLLVAPLVTIENQCREVCSTWEIPSLSLDETKAEDILTAANEKRPLVVTTTNTRVSQEEVQAALKCHLWNATFGMNGM